MIESINSIASWLWQDVKFQALMYHILLNLVVAIAAAIKNDEFNLNKLPEFLREKVVPITIIYLVAKSLGSNAQALPVLGELEHAAFAALETALLANLLENLDSLGLKLPDQLRKMVVKS